MTAEDRGDHAASARIDRIAAKISGSCRQLRSHKDRRSHGVHRVEILAKNTQLKNRLEISKSKLAVRGTGSIKKALVKREIE